MRQDMWLHMMLIFFVFGRYFYFGLLVTLPEYGVSCRSFQMEKVEKEVSWWI